MLTVNYGQLLEKYVFHVSRSTGGSDFIGKNRSMIGFSDAEIDTLLRIQARNRQDFDLYEEMAGEELQDADLQDELEDN
jgi:hypothetical protein